MKKLKCTKRSHKPEYINGIKVLYTSADQLTNKIELLRSRCKHEEPNAIGINEAKPKNNRYTVNPAEFNLEDLNDDMFENNIERDTGRGQLLYTSKDLKATQIYFDSKFEESVFVALNLKDGDSLIIGLLYRSGSGEEMNNKKMNNIITEVCANGYSHILLIGDFNYRTIDWEAFH